LPELGERFVSRFSNALAVALDQLGWTRRGFSRISGIPESQVSKYARGLIGAGAGVLETIARQLPEAQRASVVTAWLRDHLPETARGLVEIRTPAGTVAEEPQIVLEPELQRAMHYLAEMARHHREIDDLLIGLSKSLQGDRIRKQ
jgi:hypothetical protein